MTRLRASMIAGLGALLIMHPQTAGAQNNGRTVGRLARVEC